MPEKHMQMAPVAETFATQAKFTYLGNVTYGGVENHLGRYYSKYTTGWTTPNYWQLLKEGKLLPHTPFRQVEISGVRSGDYHTLEDQNANTGQPPSYFQVDYTNGWAWGHSAISETLLNEHIEGVDTGYFVQQAASNIMKGFDALTFLAEFRKLRQMFSNIVLKLWKLLKTKKTKHAWDMWLEGRYGWRVLMYEIRSFNEALEKYKEQRLRFSQKNGHSVRNVVITQNSLCNNNAGMIVTIEDTVEVSMRGAVTADVDPPEFTFNPAVTAWELTKLSWVIDWMVNVGQALYSTSFLLSNTTYSASGGVKCHLSRSVSSQETGGCGPYDYRHVSQDMWTSGTGYGILTVRTPTTVSYLPKLNPEVVDSFKILDLIALAKQRIR